MAFSGLSLAPLRVPAREMGLSAGSEVGSEERRVISRAI